jgi:dipeptidyl-peptidase-4
MVTDTWGMTVDLRAQYLASLGFLVFKLDNRGSARRGLAFEGALRHHMGGIEVRDQARGVEWLAEQGLGDPSRVGIYGWSYGGYMTAMCLLTAPDTFRAGVAGAPVTDWDGYDTHYTERYMGTPATNPEGYRAASALTHAERLVGRLLLVHGMVDENVHFRHTARLLTELERAGRPCDLLILPGERHMPRDEAGRRYVEQQVADYFTSHL